MAFISLMTLFTHRVKLLLMLLLEQKQGFCIETMASLKSQNVVPGYIMFDNRLLKSLPGNLMYDHLSVANELNHQALHTTTGSG